VKLAAADTVRVDEERIGLSKFMMMVEMMNFDRSFRGTILSFMRGNTASQIYPRKTIYLIDLINIIGSHSNKIGQTSHLDSKAFGSGRSQLKKELETHCGWYQDARGSITWDGKIL